MEWQEVESRVLAEVGYSRSNRTLAILFRTGAIYHYFFVPESRMRSYYVRNRRAITLIRISRGCTTSFRSPSRMKGAARKGEGPAGRGNPLGIAGRSCQDRPQAWAVWVAWPSHPFKGLLEATNARHCSKLVGSATVHNPAGPARWPSIADPSTPCGDLPNRCPRFG